MKIYQLIYTFVTHCLSVPELELKNQPGYHVYSCSEGLSPDEVNEVVRFCGYRLPKNSDSAYSKTPCDPSIPNKFPKTFRTFTTSSGKPVAIQVVYSGYDFNGEEGNFFAHALIFDEVSDEFSPECLYGSKEFRTFLNESDIDNQLVRYLPVLENVQFYNDLSKKIESFINEHKKEFSYLFLKTISMFSSDEKTHLCISAKNQRESDFYLLGLKKLLPYHVAAPLGISTNNIFLPSEQQNKIILNATIEGKNNITPEHIEKRTNCLYVDMENVDFEKVHELGILNKSLLELHNDYLAHKITDGQQLVVFIESREELFLEGAGQRLEKIYEKLEISVYKECALNMYEKIDSEELKYQKFDILDNMCAHIDVFHEMSDSIISLYLKEGFSGICKGEPRNIENIVKNISLDSAKKIYDDLDSYMSMLDFDKIDEKVGTLLLRIFSLLKQAVHVDTFKTFFHDNDEYIKKFVEIAARVIINDTFPVKFSAPANWTKLELCEVVAFFDSSTEDEEIHNAAHKFILENNNENWARLGVMVHADKKSQAESEADMMQIRKMLTVAGYVPFTRSSYRDLKFDVSNDMNIRDNPLLLSRLLNEFYQWQNLGGKLGEAKEKAENIAELIIEMKRTQVSCYRFMFPKLGLEILNSVSHFHEIIINVKTMEPSFWDWFYIGLKKNRDNDMIRLNYQNVFDASKEEIKNLGCYSLILKELM